MSFTDKALTTIALTIVASVGLVILYVVVRTTWAIIDWIFNKTEG